MAVAAINLALKIGFQFCRLRRRTRIPRIGRIGRDSLEIFRAESLEDLHVRGYIDGRDWEQGRQRLTEVDKIKILNLPMKIENQW